MFFGRTGGCVAGVVEQKVNQIEPGVKSGEIALYEDKIVFCDGGFAGCVQSE